MNEMSKTEYQIVTIEDIITKIPFEKYDRFLREMCEGLKQSKAMYDLATVIGESVGCPPATMPNGFTWVDDDEDTATVTVNLTDMEGASVSVKSKI